MCICILLLFNIRRSGWSPLLLAAKNGHLDLVKIFLDNNARVDVFDQVGNVIDQVVYTFDKGCGGFDHVFDIIDQAGDVFDQFG